jgi:hypothetical protein
MFVKIEEMLRPNFSPEVDQLVNVFRHIFSTVY